MDRVMNYLMYTRIARCEVVAQQYSYVRNGETHNIGDVYYVATTHTEGDDELIKELCAITVEFEMGDETFRHFGFVVPEIHLNSRSVRQGGNYVGYTDPSEDFFCC
jgi:hypothetical protein